MTGGVKERQEVKVDKGVGERNKRPHVTAKRKYQTLLFLLFDLKNKKKIYCLSLFMLYCLKRCVMCYCCRLSQDTLVKEILNLNEAFSG